MIGVNLLRRVRALLFDLDMGKYIDADRLKRYVESIGLIPQKRADYNDGRNDVIMMVLDLIDSLQQEQPEVDLEKAALHVYESWMGGTMDDVRRDMVELGRVLNARKV